MKWYSQSFSYDDPWATVTLAYFLRYPNPYASHIVSCDVISRALTSEGSLRASRLILKRGVLPKWAPQGIISRAESWVIEESEVDPEGKTVKCVTRNLDHVKVLQVVESVVLKENGEGGTLQCSEARVISRFGWGLAKRIESLGVTRFKNHLEKSRDGISLILKLINESRQPLTLTSTGSILDRPDFMDSRFASRLSHKETKARTDCAPVPVQVPTPTWQRMRNWFQWR